MEIQTNDHETIKLPNPLTLDELISEGKTHEQAQHIMRERVFGVNYARDEKGNPVENGLGSSLQPTAQHKEALRIANERVGRPSVAGNALDANALAAAVVAAVKAGNGGAANADVIATAVAAGVKAGLASAKEDAEKF